MPGVVFGGGKTKNESFSVTFFFSMKYTHYLFIFLNGTIVYGVGEALIVCFYFFLSFFYCSGFSFLEEDDKTNLKLVMFN